VAAVGDTKIRRSDGKLRRAIFITVVRSRLDVVETVDWFRSLVPLTAATSGYSIDDHVEKGPRRFFEELVK
jgi:hypothetical protein